MPQSSVFFSIPDSHKNKPVKFYILWDLGVIFLNGGEKKM